LRSSRNTKASLPTPIFVLPVCLPLVSVALATFLAIGLLWTTPPVSRDIAEQLVQMELCHVAAAISKLIKAPLTQNQFDALASFTFNLGSGRLQSSTLRARVNRLDYDGAADEFPKVV
jgi:hypothetical protein